MNRSPEDDIRVFTEALQLPSAERAAYVERACAGNPEFRRRVNALLDAHDRAGGFMESDSPAADAGARLADPVGEKPGDWIGRYKLLQRIGEGGCGVVYMAEQEEPVRRRVALKIIKAGMDTKSVIARFEAERQVLALMDHPSIAKIFDAGATESGRPYFVMELVRGVKITDYCDQNSVPTAARLELFILVCQAVQHAHQKGIIHRDLKPSNILVTVSPEGTATPMVIDFGIAKATTNQRLTDKTLFTAFEMLIGTPAYMSPEQAALTSGEVDTRSDIYSLGVLLYELLTGATPFDAGELLKAGLDEIRRVIREEEPVRPSTRLSRLTGADLTTVAEHRHVAPPALIRTVKGDLDWIAMKALEKNRVRRYETANGLALDVQRYLANETVSARPPSALYRLQKTILRNKLLFGGIGIVGVVLIVGLVAVSTSLAKERRARQGADTARQQAEADQVKAVAEATKSRQVTQFLSGMLQGVGPSVAQGRDTVMLREILDKAAARLEAELASQPATKAELQKTLGEVYLQLALYDKAEAMDRAVLAAAQKQFGMESVQATVAMRNVAAVLHQAFKMPEAEKLYLETLALQRKLLGPEDIEVATTLHNLSAVYWRTGRMAEAEAANRQALAIRRRQKGDTDLDVAISLSGLALILERKGDFAEAETMMREVLATRRKLLGPDHPSTVGSLSQVGSVLEQQGKREEAEGVQREVLALRRKLVAETHSDVARALITLAHTLRKEGKFAEAASFYREAIAARKSAAGSDVFRPLALNGLGLTLRAEGKLTEAETWLREALAVNPGSLGARDSSLAEVMDNLMHVLADQGKFAEAEDVIGRYLTPDLVNQPRSAMAFAARADLRARGGWSAEAAADIRKALEFFPDDLDYLNLLAPLLVRAGDQEAYQRLCQRLLTQSRKTRDPAEAGRMAWAWLVLPSSGVELQVSVEMTALAVTAGKYHEKLLPSLEGAQALADYRRGNFAGAVEWAQKALGGTGPVRAQAYSVLAMAQHHLKQVEAARDSLTRGLQTQRQRTRYPLEADLGEDWRDWIYAQALGEEAAALLQPGSTPARKVDQL